MGDLGQFRAFLLSAPYLPRASYIHAMDEGVCGAELEALRDASNAILRDAKAALALLDQFEVRALSHGS